MHARSNKTGCKMGRRQTGFTLVEILIVVVILGILAAIVIPQFADASETARKSNVVTQLQTIRSQIELYKAQHHDVLPNLVTAWDPLTTKTDINGATGTDYGPYLQQAPVNAMNGLSTVVDGTSSSSQSSAVGFIYDYAAGAGTGKIVATDKNGMAIFVESN